MMAQHLILSQDYPQIEVMFLRGYLTQSRRIPLSYKVDIRRDSISRLMQIEQNTWLIRLYVVYSNGALSPRRCSRKDRTSGHGRKYDWGTRRVRSQSRKGHVLARGCKAVAVSREGVEEK